MNLLVFKLSPIGDTVLFLPVVQAIRRLRPEWRVTVFTTPVCAGLFRPWLDASDIIAVERSSLQRSWQRPWSLLGWLRLARRLRPDAVLLSFDQSSMARFVASASGATLRIGGAGSAVRWRRGLTHEVQIIPGHSLAEWEWEMARVLAQQSGIEWPAGPPSPWIPGATRYERAGRSRVLVHAGASRAYQRWPVESYIRLAECLSRDCDVTWVNVPEITPLRPGGQVRSVDSRDLADFVALASCCELFVGNHSGPFHLAAAIGAPCVIPTGPTLPACDPPWHADRRRLLRMPGLACLPCDKLTVSPNRCLNHLSPMACMNYWTVEAVEQVCRDMLSNSLGRPISRDSQ